MNTSSLILRTTGYFLLPLLLVFSIFMLLRGHDEPGGGFIAGLVAAAAVCLHLFFTDVNSARELLRIDPRDLVGWGLVLATLSGIPAALQGKAFFTAIWIEPDLPLLGVTKLGTPLLFDIGVYAVVIGSVLTIVLSLAKAED